MASFVEILNESLCHYSLKNDYYRIAIDLDSIMKKHNNSKQFFRELIKILQIIYIDKKDDKLITLRQTNFELKEKVKSLGKQILEIQNNRSLEKRRLAILEQNFLL